jgi:LPS-assembly protein
MVSGLFRTLRTSCVGIAAVTMIASAAAQETAQESQTLILADEMRFNEASSTVSAIGNVEIDRDGRILLADEVTYNQDTDTAVAKGNVSLLDDNGSVMFFEEAQVTGDLKEGFAREVRVLLADKSRMAARLIRRRDGNVNEFTRVVYSACDLECGHEPVWQVKAAKVKTTS